MTVRAVRQLLVPVLLVLAMSCAASAWAQGNHEAVYSWYGSGTGVGGSHVAQLQPTPLVYDVGDRSGQIWVEVKEDCQWHPEVDGGMWLYQYTVTTVYPGTNHPPGAEDQMPGVPGDQWLTSFAVPSFGAPADLQVVSADWNFEDTGTVWRMYADPGVGLDGDTAGFSVYSPIAWTVSGGGMLDYLDEEDERHWLSSADWYVSHPQVPEPGSLALLACGVAGLLPVLRRRRTV